MAPMARKAAGAGGNRAANLAKSAAAFVAAIQAADALWDVANKDGRIVKAVKDAAERLKRLGTKDHARALVLKWDALEKFVATIADDPDHADVTQVWNRELDRLRRKLPLAEAQDGRERKKAFKELETQTRVLTTAVLQYATPAEFDILTDEETAPDAPRPKLRQRLRSQPATTNGADSA